MDELEQQRLVAAKDAVLEEYFPLMNAVTDLQSWKALDAQKAQKVKQLDDQLKQVEQRLKRRAEPNAPRSSSASPHHLTRSSPVPKLEHGPSHKPVASGLAVQDLREERKRKASSELQASRESKRPRDSANIPLLVDDVVIPTPLSELADGRWSPGQRRHSSPSQRPSRPSPDIGLRQPVGPARIVTYDQVRQRGTIENIWDTIVEHPRRPQSWYILHCEEHGMHFKKDALIAAAKHLDGASHNNQGRDRVNALDKLGYRVIDCTKELQAKHNADVEIAFSNNYVPPHRKSSHRGHLFSDRSTKTSPAHYKGNPPTKHVAVGAVHSPKSAQVGIAHPKEFHIYYCNYDDKTEAGMTVWPVLILGWDDLTPGGDMLARRLVDTELLQPASRPPKCYVYSDQQDKILGWRSGYDDPGNPSKFQQRRFPIMFFDEGRSYAWVPSKDLAIFPIAAKNAPKRKGHKEKAFHEAREFIAAREGFSSWEDREDARKDARKNGLAAPWTAGQRLPQRQITSTNLAASPVQNTRRLYARSLSGDATETEEPSWATVTDEIRAEMIRGGEIPGDGDYEKGSDNDDSDTNSDAAMSVPGAFPMSSLFDPDWRSIYTLRSEKKKAKQDANHVRKGTATPDERTTGDREVPLNSTATTQHREQMRIDMNLRAASAPVKTEQPGNRNYSAKRTSQTRQRASVSLESSNDNPTPDIGQPCTGRSAENPLNLIQPNAQTTHQPSGTAVAKGSSPAARDLYAEGVSHDAAAVVAPPTREAIECLNQSADAVAPSTTSALEMSPLRAPTLAPVADETSNSTHVFELSSCQRNGVECWNKATPGAAGIKLYKSAGKIRSEEGGVFQIDIDAAAYGSLHLKAIAGLPGNSLITVTGTDGGTLQLMFDRKQGDEETASGKVQARNFVDWLREERRKLGLKLKTSRE